jgi:hypothetical protein
MHARWLLLVVGGVATFAQTLPDGPGKAVVERACSECHAATIVMGRHMNRDQWRAEVKKMMEEGAKLTDAEYAQVVDYLVKFFGDGSKVEM